MSKFPASPLCRFADLPLTIHHSPLTIHHSPFATHHSPLTIHNSHISVIIPNWNGAHHLPTCLDSLRAQTFRVFEVIVADNGSHDDSC
ncbi:MAG: glycosyltransferase, partial [Anaerolineae bacterium]|nr:glycosyltransferase [Anaerolineae bacterium]